MEALMIDIRHGVRILLRNPAFTLTAVSILALGIGANTAIFTVVDAALLQRLPFADADSLFIVNGVADQPSGPQIRGASYREIMKWRQLSRTFEDLAAVATVALNLWSPDTAERLSGEIVSEGYFSLLRVDPLRGRVFTATESSVPGAGAVVLISDALWGRRFERSARVFGSEVVLNGEAYTVIGVLPAGFSGVSLAADFWIPMGMVSAVRPVSVLELRADRWLFAVGRLLPGSSMSQVQDDLDAVSARSEAAVPETNTDRRAQVRSLRDNYLGQLQLTLVALLVSVSAVLLIACVNVTNLLLARCTSRGSEVALRMALGAGRGRLGRQMLTESVTLAVLGGAAGILVAVWGIEGLHAAIPAGALPVYVDAQLNLRAYGFVTAVTLLSGVLFGAVPAFRFGVSDLGTQLRRGDRTMSPVGAAQSAALSLHSLLVVGQVAITAALLICAGLTARSLSQQMAVEAGFESQGVTVFRLTLPRAQYAHARRVELAGGIVQALLRLPRVEAAAVGTDLPLRGLSSATFLWRESEAPDDEASTRVYRHRISPQYLSLLGIPLIEGRPFDAADGSDSPPVALVGKATAARLWPGHRSVLGERVRLDRRDGDLVEIVGVVGDVRFRRITDDLMSQATDPEIYLPWAQGSTPVLEVAVRSVDGRAIGAGLLRAAVRRLDPGLALARVATMGSVLDAQTAMSRLQTRLLNVSGLVALTLGAVGIYGLLAYTVARRRREIGIRLALGATPETIVREIVGRGMSLAALGLVAGTALGIAAAAGMGTLLFEVSPFDPLTLVSAGAVLLGTALLASYLPARRASNVDPTRVLRTE